MCRRADDPFHWIVQIKRPLTGSVKRIHVTAQVPTEDGIERNVMKHYPGWELARILSVRQEYGAAWCQINSDSFMPVVVKGVKRRPKFG